MFRVDKEALDRIYNSHPENKETEAKQNWLSKLSLFQGGAQQIVKNVLFDYLGIEDAEQFMKDSDEFKEIVEVRHQVALLHQHLHRRENVKADAMLTKNPRLLLEKGYSVDYSGRRFLNCAALELVKWSGDVEQIEMLLGHFKTLANQSSENIKEILSKQWNSEVEYEFEEFNTEAKSIITKRERRYSFKEMILTGEEFNKLLETKSGGEIIDSFAHTRIGVLQRQLPTWLAMACCYGLQDAVNEMKAEGCSAVFKRFESLEFKYGFEGRKKLFYPLDMDMADRLGVHHVVGPNGRGGQRRTRVLKGIDELFRDLDKLITDFFIAKQKELGIDQVVAMETDEDESSKRKYEGSDEGPDRKKPRI